MPVWRSISIPLTLVVVALVACVVRARPVYAWPAPTGSFAVEQSRLWLPTPTGKVHVLAWIPKQSAQPAPLVLFAPGWGNAADDCASLLGDLASHGYVAVAFDDLAQDPQTPDESSQDRALRSGSLSLDSPEAFRQTSDLARQRTALAVRKGVTVLDAVLAAPAFAGKVDKARIGFVGYSFGGAAGVDQTLADPRIKAVANLDGWLFGKATTEAVRVPYLLVSIDEDFPPRQWRNSANPGERAIAEGAATDQAIHRALLSYADFTWLRFSGMNHGDLSDAGLRWSLDRMLHGKSADGALLASRKAELTTSVRQFLDRHVKGDQTPFPPTGGHLPAGVFRVGVEDLS